MLIQCEKCSTVYELDDKLVPPQGAPVQCSKCQFVFKAYPPEPASEVTELIIEGPEGETPRRRGGDLVREGGVLAGTASEPVVMRPVPPAPPAAPVAQGTGSGTMPSRPASPPAESRAPPPSPSVSGAADEPRFTADGRPIRKVPFPTMEPSPPGPRPPPAPRPVPVKRPVALGGPIGWIVVVAVLLAIVIAAALFWRARAGDGAAARRQDGQSRAVPQGGTPAASPRK